MPLGSSGSRIVEIDFELRVHATLNAHSIQAQSGCSGRLSHLDEFSLDSDFAETTILGLVGGAARVALSLQGSTSSCPQVVAKLWWSERTLTIQAAPRCDDGGLDQ